MIAVTQHVSWYTVGVFCLYVAAICGGAAMIAFAAEYIERQKRRAAHLRKVEHWRRGQIYLHELDVIDMPFPGPYSSE